jgi:phage repressor protein C with HTH and peptisase S24 domain
MIKERISQILEYKGIAKEKFYSEIGMTSANFRGKARETPINSTAIENILSAIPDINISWLITGNGSMLREPVAEGSEPTDPPAKRKLIPFYEVEAAAGTIQVSNMDVMEEPVEWIDAGDWFPDADCAMRVHGDSMFPVYKSGSIVVIREVHDKHLIIYGQDYVIITPEYRAIKRLQKSQLPHNWLACSANNEVYEKGELAGKLIHEPFDVPIDAVYKLFRVLGCVTRTESSRIVYTKS